MQLTTATGHATDRGFHLRRQDELDPHLESALSTLATTDRELLVTRASERAACHRLAVHLECALRRERSEWDVDCEYDRLLAGPKIGVMAGQPDKRSYPDIIVHRRGEAVNHLVIEAKVLTAATRKADLMRDFDKLAGFRRPGGEYRYEKAYFLLVLPEQAESMHQWPFAVFEHQP